jgi:hypothetical protein
MMWMEAQMKGAEHGVTPTTEQYHTVFLIDTVTGKVWYAAWDAKSMENAPIFLPAKGPQMNAQTK